MNAEPDWIQAKVISDSSMPKGEHYFGLKVDIVFGMPKYQCRYHGICKLDADENDLVGPVSPRCGSGKGRLFLLYERYALICFQKVILTAPTRKVHFEREYFVLKEAVRFAEALTRRLGRQYGLAPGRYRIMDRADVYSVLFRIETTTFPIEQ